MESKKPYKSKTVYNYDMCVEICEQVSMGRHIKEILESKEEYPTFPTWCKWKRENDVLFNLYTRSIQDKAEMILFEIIQTMNDLRDGIIDAPSARVIIDTYKWMAAKFYPKMFGDKADITLESETVNKIIVEYVKAKDES